MLLVTAALNEELGGQFDDSIITGIGKINAAMKMTATIWKRNPSLVVNFGTAASSVFKKNSIVQVTQIHQHDMQCNLIEYLKNNPIGIEAKSIILEEYKAAICYTGDQFLNEVQCQHFNGVCDMEAFALARVCQVYGIPFLCFKAITDGHSPHSETDWRSSLNNAAKEFRMIYNKLKEIHDQSEKESKEARQKDNLYARDS